MGHILLQSEITGSTEPAPLLREAGFTVHEFSGHSAGWRDRLEDLDCVLEGQPILAFVSLGTAACIRRAFPTLARGLIFRPDQLRHHVWSSLVPPELQLNQSYVMMPFGHLAHQASSLERLFGERVFLRPDSALKVFPGQTAVTRELGFVSSMLRQLHAVLHGELVVIDRYREIARPEYRFWLTEEAVVTQAAYAFVENGVASGHPAPPCPDEVMALASELFDRSPLLASVDDALVADFALDENGQAKLVELNAWSTSGFYPGMDVVAVARAGLAALRGT